MGIWLSCGHREDNFEKHHSITTKEWDVGEEGAHLGHHPCGLTKSSPTKQSVKPATKSTKKKAPSSTPTKKPSTGLKTTRNKNGNSKSKSIRET